MMFKALKSNNKFINDLLWYFSGAIIPMVFNFLKTPIFTRHYSTEDFGVLGLVMITLGYISTLTYSWISSCLWRYYNKYKIENILSILYSNLIFIFVISSVFSLFLTWVAWLFLKSQEQSGILLLLALIHFTQNTFLGLYFIVLRLKGKAKIFNLVISLQSFTTFLVLLVLAFGLDFSIISMLLSYVIVDSIFILYLGIRIILNGKIKIISFSLISKKHILELINFGGISLIASIFLMLIISSDRYIIAWFSDIDKVGIYTKTYDIAQMSVLSIIFIYFSTINPSMNKLLETKINESKIYLSQYIYSFLLIITPFVFLASLFSKEINTLLLGESFREAYWIMPYIFISLLIYGIIKFYENEYKFKDKIKQMAIFFGFGFVLNLVLNLILVPYKGYEWASITTLFSYIAIFLLFATKDNFKFFTNQKIKNLIVKISSIMIVIYLIHYTIQLIKIEFQFSWLVEAFIYLILFLMVFKKDLSQLEVNME